MPCLERLIKGMHSFISVWENMLNFKYIASVLIGGPLFIQYIWSLKKKKKKGSGKKKISKFIWIDLIHISQEILKVRSKCCWLKQFASVLLCVSTPLKISRELCRQNQQHYKQTQASSQCSYFTFILGSWASDCYLKKQLLIYHQFPEEHISLLSGGFQTLISFDTIMLYIF